jgi:glycosyltransferase involved in cell wall biosynthesis
MPEVREVIQTCIQINLQRGFGGGETYTAAFSCALQSIGIETMLFAHPRASAWSSLPTSGIRIEALADPADLMERLRGHPPRWLVFHTFAPAAVIEALRSQGHLVTAFAHMPIYGRDPQPLLPFQLILGVSRHVIASLHAAGINAVYPAPLYGIADVERSTAQGSMLYARSRYDWDRHKVRDRLLGAMEPFWQPLLPRRVFERKRGLTLGIVSRLTPIKQFPLLFSYLAGILVRHPAVQLEIFGSGGYASVRDLVRSLRPIRERVRFWGHQMDVGAVYRQIDFLLTGLPEKEALGLNVIEAQACGTPVLAPDAPPFDETVMHGTTGLRYRDPRIDGGADFERTLQLVLGGGFRFNAEAAQAHLAEFSKTAFAERLRVLVGFLATLGDSAPEVGTCQP